MKIKVNADGLELVKLWRFNENFSPGYSFLQNIPGSEPNLAIALENGVSLTNWILLLHPDESITFRGFTHDILYSVLDPQVVPSIQEMQRIT